MSIIRAMVIDDSSPTRKVIMKSLRQTGLAEFAFTEAEDGIEAMHLLVNQTPDIIFVDMNMPRMSGIEFVRCYRRQTEKCPPIVMLTAETRHQRLSEAFRQVQVDAFMLKPLDLSRLKKGLATLLDRLEQGLDAEDIPFTTAAAHAIKVTMAEACGVDLAPVEPDIDVRQGDCVFGAVSLVGDVQWAVSAGFARTTAEALACKLAGFDGDIVEEDMGDAIGELTNMFSGRLKASLASKGINAQVSFPTVTCAQGLRTLIQKRQGAAVDYAHFKSSVGPLWIAVSAGQTDGMIL